MGNAIADYVLHSRYKTDNPYVFLRIRKTPSLEPMEPTSFNGYLRKYTEKDDELSKLHRYKAGYISKYITAALFFIVLLVVKDFSFAFTGDFIDDLSLPIIILITGELISDITFIILEKFQLD